MLTSLPDPSDSLCKTIENMFWDFLWHGKKDRIKRTKMIQTVANEGLGMVELKSFITGLKVSWIKRLWSSESFWAVFTKNVLIKSFSSVILHGSAQLIKDSQRTTNTFWKHVLLAWSRFNEAKKLTVDEIFAERVWFSDFTTFKHSIINEWDSNGIKFIYDLWNNMTRRWYTYKR